MLSNKQIYNQLIENEITFFSGVPDSLLKHFCSYITAHCSNGSHIIAANEGGAIGLACGHYLATGNPGFVYLQNSGIGNIINPILSIADPEVFRIPMLIMIGWRGEPGIKDEPQHRKQGRVSESILKSIEMPYLVISQNISEAKKEIKFAIQSIRKYKSPFAILVKKNTFEPFHYMPLVNDSYSLTRERAIITIVDNLDKSDIIVSTTGKASRELFEYRATKRNGHERDFLTIGGMGHCSQIALGIALNKKEQNVFCIDGDGAAIMHLGAFAIIGQQESKNFKHLIINNGSHDSVGGQPTMGYQIDFCSIAKSCGYKYYSEVCDQESLARTINQIKTFKGAALIDIRVSKGSRDGLSRPTITPEENKLNFMHFLKNK